MGRSAQESRSLAAEPRTRRGVAGSSKAKRTPSRRFDAAAYPQGKANGATEAQTSPLSLPFILTLAPLLERGMRGGILAHLPTVLIYGRGNSGFVPAGGCEKGAFFREAPVLRKPCDKLSPLRRSRRGQIIRKTFAVAKVKHFSANLEMPTSRYNSRRDQPRRRKGVIL